MYLEDDKYKEGKITGGMKALVNGLWKMMLGVWKTRNDNEHGENSLYSKRDLKTLMDLVDTLYDQYESTVLEEDSWLFNKNNDERKKMNITNIITWIETVSNLCTTNNVEKGKEIKYRTDHVLNRMCVSSIYS